VPPCQLGSIPSSRSNFMRCHVGVSAYNCVMTDSDIDTKNLDLIRQIYDKSHESRDKALLTLCSAALGVSLTFYEKVYTGHALWLLNITWVCLAVSMLSTVYSFITAARTADRLDTFNVNKAKYENDIKFITSIHKWARYTKRLNILAISGFTFGIVLFIIFAIINTGQGKNMGDPRELQNGLPPMSSMMPDLAKGTPPISSAMPVVPAAPAAPAAPAQAGGNAQTGK